MAYIDRRERAYVMEPRRVLLGVVAAPTVPWGLYGLIAGDLTDFWLIGGLGALSVITFYLPLLAWRLPRTDFPLIACVGLGVIAAPGPFGFALGVTALISMATPAVLMGIFLFTAPLGAAGGFIFWLCAVWRSDRVGAEAPAGPD